LLIYGIKKLKLAGLRLERFDPEYSPLIPDPMCESIAYGSVILDLGSVINDCGDKHYNTGDASGYLYVMQMGRHDHPRSIVTDQLATWSKHPAGVMLCIN